ncbi:MAG: GNAT family N-acetyltransferase [Clostridia bacterium]|nr:GNAT family N-acetyltransferase [Clostridia bacterium]MBO4884102.1 GNAT family N-acetyltransferase [Clostridia bacterium]
MIYEYREATLSDLETLWRKNIAQHPGDPHWAAWREEYIGFNRSGLGRTFSILCDGEAIGEGTLLFSPECRPIGGQPALADGKTTANVNALRIEKAHEGQGHISRLMRLMEDWARAHGYTRLTIGVDAAETRNLAIYLHWGFSEYVMAEEEDEILRAGPVLYYAKTLSQK